MLDFAKKVLEKLLISAFSSPLKQPWMDNICLSFHYLFHQCDIFGLNWPVGKLGDQTQELREITAMKGYLSPERFVK